MRQEIRQHPGGFQDYLSKKNPNWLCSNRVTFHLAENKRDAEHPFAFLATYASRLSTDGACSTKFWVVRWSNTPAQEIGRRCWPCLSPSSAAAEAALWSRDCLSRETFTKPLPGGPRRRTGSCRTFRFSKSPGSSSACRIGGNHVNRRGPWSAFALTDTIRRASESVPCSVSPWRSRWTASRSQKSSCKRCSLRWADLCNSRVSGSKSIGRNWPRRSNTGRPCNARPRTPKPQNPKTPKPQNIL